MRNIEEKLVHGIDREIIARLSRRMYEDFRSELNDVLSLYLNLLGDFNIKNALGEEYALKEIPVYITRVRKWCKDIKEMVDGYFEGDLIKTVKIYNRLFNRNSRSYPLQFPLSEIKQHSVWYRGRKNENDEQRDRKELFHVSFRKRGIIGSQRFSILGFPCLYLASSLECCIDEINSSAPISISAFKVLSDIKVLDLSFYPSISEPKTLWRYLYLYPIKIACSIPAQPTLKDDEKRYFIPEYIVPEYVLHGKIKQPKELSQSLGIIYTSTAIFSETVTEEEVRKYTNLVVPTINIKERGYCDGLRNMFSMTEPITLYNWRDEDSLFFENRERSINDMEFCILADTNELNENQLVSTFIQ